MAELFGIVAGGAGLASLAIQILENTRKLADLYSAIRDAPEEMGIILEEINILANVLVGFSRMHCPTGIEYTKPTAQAFTDTLRYCKLASERLSSIVSELDAGMRFQPKRFSAVTVLKKKKLEALLFRLERAKSTLALAQILCIRSLQNQHYESHRPKTSVESLREKGQPVRLTTSEWIDHDPFVDQSTIYNVGIGTVRIRKRSRSRKSPQSYHQEVQFRLALWFKVYGISVIIDRQFGLPQIILQPLRLVPGNSPIMKACAMGNTEEVRCLITTKEASPWDTTPDDVTPLHIAAAWLRPETCKLLLDFGAETATAIRFRSISWTPLALAGEQAGYYRIWLFPDLEPLRPEPEDGLARMRETMRILLDGRKSELHIGYFPGKPGEWNGSRSTLHGFRGSSEDYQWLARQEMKLEMESDNPNPDDYKASIVLQQTEMFPNSSFMASLGQITNMVHLVNFSDSEGFKLLHYLMHSNWGSEPGVWMNGADVFTISEVLLRQGADPCAQNSTRETPLMYAARHSLLYLSQTNEALSCTEASGKYSRFLQRWVSLLYSCGIDLKHYYQQEQGLGAGNFTRCSWWQDISHPLVSDWLWYVRVCFEVGQSPDALRIEFEYQLKPRVMTIPGAWID